MMNICEAMAEWVMCEADLWDIGGLSNAESFQFEHWVDI